MNVKHLLEGGPKKSSEICDEFQCRREESGTVTMPFGPQFAVTKI